MKNDQPTQNLRKKEKNHQKAPSNVRGLSKEMKSINILIQF